MPDQTERRTIRFEGGVSHNIGERERHDGKSDIEPLDPRQRLRANLAEGSFDETSLVEGVNFSSAPVGDDQADAATEGTAAAHDALIGADFECGALLIYRMEFNDAGPEPFIVELTVIPAEDNRG